jgi:hypothetical protein
LRRWEVFMTCWSRSHAGFSYYWHGDQPQMIRPVYPESVEKMLRPKLILSSATASGRAVVFNLGYAYLRG